jgi:seryl-tRNA synthetase
MDTLDEKLRSQNQEIELLEQEKQEASRKIAVYRDTNSPYCKRLKERIEQVNKRIEELYSQISLTKIRNMMGLL